MCWHVVAFKQDSCAVTRKVCFPLTVKVSKFKAVRFLPLSWFDQLVIDLIEHQPSFDSYFVQ